MKKFLGAVLAGVVSSMVLVGVPDPAVAGTRGTTYSAGLRAAIGDLQVASEVRTGYDRDEFRHWIDADGDGCNTRYEVLAAESEDYVNCHDLSDGRWYSYYDGEMWYDPSDVDIDHMVPLAEAWDSGARHWTDTTRKRFANDLGDYRSLVGVTDNVNQSKGDRDPADWMPRIYKCRYLKQWVAVKHRWRLSIDDAEKQALRDKVDAHDCSGTISVTLAR